MISKKQLAFGLIIPLVFATLSIAQQTETTESNTPQESDWGGLTVHQSGHELKTASHIVILMHGFGAPGRDLVPLSKAIEAPEKTAFVLPEAPNELARGGRAWWAQRGDYEKSRNHVVSLLKFVRESNADATIVLGGFSQGAMLASNFLPKDSELVDALVLLSPSGQTREEITGKGENKPVVFLAHGREDRVLPFAGSERLHEKLSKLEYKIEWLPFDGAHTIPREVITGVSKFLSELETSD